jgi:hypothetical protein
MIPEMTLAEAQAQFEAAKKSLTTEGSNLDPKKSVAALETVIVAAEKHARRWGLLRLLAAQALGVYLDSVPRRGKGRPRKNVEPNILRSLTELGLKDRNVAAAALKVGRMPSTIFDAYIDSEDIPSFAGLLRFAENESPLAATYKSVGKPMSLGAFAPAQSSGRLNWWDGGENSTSEWYTPAEVFEAMDVEFDVDVCSPGKSKTPWIPAKRFITKRENGLASDWHGFAWMNCPFGEKAGVWDWIERFIQHGNGVALVTDFTSTEWFHRLTGGSDAILFVKPKIQFLPRMDGRGNALAASCAPSAQREFEHCGMPKPMGEVYAFNAMSSR